MLEGLKLEIKYWDESGSEMKTLSNCNVSTEFKYSRIEFVLLKRGSKYFVCTYSDGELFSLIDYNVNDDMGNEYTSGEIMSMFRTSFTKNKLDNEAVELFIKSPKEYIKKYKSKKVKRMRK